MSLSVEIDSQEPQAIGLVRRRPLLTKRFIPNQDFQQASTSNERKNPLDIFEPPQQIQEPTVHLEECFEKQPSEISEEAHINETPKNAASNFDKNLYDRNIKSKVSKKGNLSKRRKKSIKTLQPKSASAILNELVETHYRIEELYIKKKLKWSATVLIDDIEYNGCGPSKFAAKNAAAEVALKHICSKVLDSPNAGKMSILDRGFYNHPLPYHQITSYDIFQLIASWNYVLNNYTLNQPVTTNYYKQKKIQPPERMDPVVLITQSMNATFEEVPKGSNPKNVTFLFKCNVGEDSFFGLGHSKRVAKKMAAYEACNKVMGIRYPRQIYVSSS